MSQTKNTFCRICEPMCPLLATMDENGKVVKLQPNPEHPISKGFSCNKGPSFLSIHNDPDRLDYPLKRTNAKSAEIPEYERVSWDQAFADIGERLRKIIEEQGPDAVGLYLGNPCAFNSKLFSGPAYFHKIIGSSRRFTSTTQDCANKWAAAEAIFGGYIFTLPDLKNTDYLMCFGTNPKISHWTTVSYSKSMDEVKDIIRRGGKVKYVNPRKVESVSETTGDLIQINPDTDTFYLAAVLHELYHNGGFDTAIIEQYGRNLEGLLDFISRYPAERVAEVTGIATEDIKATAKDIQNATSASFYMSTGVNQSREGTLAYWLMNMLSFVTGNLGQDGGNFVGKEFFKFRRKSVPRTVDTPFGPLKLVGDDLPASLLNDFFEAEEGGIKAFICISGNPALSVGGGEEKFLRAAANLDLMISIDLYQNVSSQSADYVLPATDWIERSDLNLYCNGHQPESYIQYTDALAEPKAERKNDWWIMSRLAQEVGGRSLLDLPNPTGWEAAENLLKREGTLSLDDIRNAPHQTIVLGEVEDKKELYEKYVFHEDGRIDCCPQELVKGFAHCESLFKSLENEEGECLKLVSFRNPAMHNSWMANADKLRHGPAAQNFLHMHQDDARARELGNGEKVRVYNDHGALETFVMINNDLKPGVVALSHGFGHQRATTMKTASSNAGSNYNRLSPSGPDSFDPVSNQAWMSGLHVNVERIVAL